MKKLLFFVLVFTINFSVSAADSFSTLEERMSGKEFKDTGLVKLSDAELATLNAWVRSHSVATLENKVARPTTLGTVSISPRRDLRGFESRPKNDEYSNTIYANIAGTFDGWNGNNNLFTLTNGMIWQQVEGDTFNIPVIEDPEVTITKGMVGGWRLSVVGYNRKIRVKRIQ